MKVFGLLLTLASFNVVAASKYYEIGMDLSVDGKRVPAPRLFVKENVTETVIQGNKFFEVTATENADKSVKMDFTMGEFTEDGERIITARPTVISQENKRADMKVIRDDGSEEMNLSVVPLVKKL